MSVEALEALQEAKSSEAAETPAPVEVTPEAPSPTPTEEAVEIEAPKPEAKTEPSQELYELPDGRKVDAATLAKEWKENFMPDYTKKSQALAAKNEPKKDTEQPKWADPNWQPETYDELLNAAEQRVLAKLEAEKRAEIEKKEQVNSWVESQMSEIRQMEPNVSEELLFQHANKYGFADLKTAYQNMKDFNIAVKNTEKKVIQNLKNREEPVAAKPNTGIVDDGADYQSVMDSRESAAEVLARIKG